jgi:hypothetical protein
VTPLAATLEEVFVLASTDRGSGGAGLPMDHIRRTTAFSRGQA